MSLEAILALGFLLGMRHATDADHVVAVSTIVSRERSLRAAAPIGVLWGLGHTLTILLLGSLIIVFGVVVPPRIGLSLELLVALMLVLLGAWNVRSLVGDAVGRAALSPSHEHPHEPTEPRQRTSLRPLLVGVVHGAAGSAAVTLLVLGTLRSAARAALYLLVFGAGTIAGMLLITTALAMPLAAAARRFERLQRALVLGTGVASIVFGAVLGYQVGIVQGLFTSRPIWMPR